MVLAGVLVLLWLLAGITGGCGRSNPTTGHEGGSLANTPSLARTLDLPHVRLDTDFNDGVPGECFATESLFAIAIKLPGVAGHSLGPATPKASVKTGPIYVNAQQEAPGILPWSSTSRIPGSPSHAINALWISRSPYDGPVLIRGGRIDESGVVGFGDKPRSAPELRLPRGNRKPWGALAKPLPDGWRAAEVLTRIQTPGCYGFQIDGIGFSYHVVFAVAQSVRASRR